MESAGEAQDGTATPVAALVAGAASAPPAPALPPLQRSRSTGHQLLVPLY